MKHGHCGFFFCSCRACFRELVHVNVQYSVGFESELLCTMGTFYYSKSSFMTFVNYYVIDCFPTLAVPFQLDQSKAVTLH